MRLNWSYPLNKCTCCGLWMPTRKSIATTITTVQHYQHYHHLNWVQISIGYMPPFLKPRSLSNFSSLISQIVKHFCSCSLSLNLPLDKSEFPNQQFFWIYEIFCCLGIQESIACPSPVITQNCFTWKCLFGSTTWGVSLKPGLNYHQLSSRLYHQKVLSCLAQMSLKYVYHRTEFSSSLSWCFRNALRSLKICLFCWLPNDESLMMNPCPFDEYPMLPRESVLMFQVCLAACRCFECRVSRVVCRRPRVAVQECLVQTENVTECPE